MTPARRTGLVRRGWRRVWDAAPRQLRFTRAGKVLVGLALATGFAAINTGNNLLFLGWGLVLSAIILSGVLSESVVRSLRVTAGPTPRARAGEPGHVVLRLANLARRMPAYAIEVGAHLDWADGEATVAAPSELRVEPAAVRDLWAAFTPSARGLHRVRRFEVQTAYPFGFFEKGRRFDGGGHAFWVMPAAVPVEGLLATVEAAAGELAARRPGPGEDFFGLRPYRPGDDPRRIAHRRSARTGRWVVRETEAAVGGAVVLELHLAAGPDCERAIAAFGSVAEQMLARGRSVGIVAPGVFLPPEPGDGQRWLVLMALARLEPAARLPRAPSTGAALVVLASAPQSETGLVLVRPADRGALASDSDALPAPEGATPVPT